MLSKLNLGAALSRIGRTEDPLIVGEVNSTHIKLVRLLGPFVWHHHADEDEMFLVLKGELEMNVREAAGADAQAGAGAEPEARRADSAFVERRIVLAEGEMIVIPRGVEHMPVAHQECHILLVEPASTLNTGNVRNEKTRDTLARL